MVEKEYGFLVPFYNGVNYTGTVVRTTLSATTRRLHEVYFKTNYTKCCIAGNVHNVTEYCCSDGLGNPMPSYWIVS